MDKDFLINMMRAWLYGEHAVIDFLTQASGLGYIANRPSLPKDADRDAYITERAKDCAEHLIGNWEAVERCNAYILANDYPWGDA